jgi:hypothetical protein
MPNVIRDDTHPFSFGCTFRTTIADLAEVKEKILDAPEKQESYLTLDGEYERLFGRDSYLNDELLMLKRKLIDEIHQALKSNTC